VANRQEDFLFQKMAVVRQDKSIPLDLSFLKEATFVETLDLSGPRLMLTFDDPDSILRNDVKLKIRDVIEVRIADVERQQEEDEAGMDQALRFVIWTMPNQGNLIIVNCLELNVDRLKIPARETIVFTKKPPETILKKLAPGLKYSVGSFAALEDYHLLPGQRPSKLLRQMAREKGALCFFRRGSMVFRTLASRLKLEPKSTYEYGNQAAEKQIISYVRPNAKSVLRDAVERNVIAWNMEKGFLKSGKKTDKPPEFVPAANLATMNNLLAMPYPAIDFIASGNGALVPGIPISLKWNMLRIDAPLDESLPSKVVIGTVAHHYSSQKYFCRVKGVLPL